MAKRVVGLTGGIASGKSTVARMLVELGAALIDADQLARDIVRPATPGLARLVEAFGNEILREDGTLDRKKLGEIVFADGDAREKLNAITHPLIAQAGAERIAALQDSDAPYIVYEAALLVENGAHELFSGLIVVACTPETQLARIIARDDLTEEEAKARIVSQLPLEKKVEVADYVIENDGDLETTRAQVLALHEELAGGG